MPYSILFLFNSAYDKEFADFKAGRVPKHRFFGFYDLSEQGHRTAFCPMPRFLRGILGRQAVWKVYQAMQAVLHQSRYDCIFATHESCALPALLMRRLGLLRKPVIAINVALLRAGYTAGWRKRLLTWLLRGADRVVSYCSAQIPGLEAEYQLKKGQAIFIPLCVDIDFFRPTNPPSAPEKYCASVGTNAGKDYPTLIAALPEAAKLIIVTDGYNAEIIAHCLKPGQRVEVRQAVPIDQLKDLYENALCMIIPLSEARFSSGQTVLLENMALGKVVVVSDVSSVRDYAQTGVGAITVPAGDAAALGKVISEIWADPARFAAVGEQARQRVKENFSTRAFAEQLTAAIGSIGTR